MKTEEYYNQSNFKRLSDLQKASEKSMDNEYVKLFKGKEHQFLSILIKNILELKDFNSINIAINEYKVSVRERDLDMLRVLYSEKQKDYEDLNDYWKNEVRHMGKAVLKEIPFKIVIEYSENNIIHKDYEFHLKLFQELGILY
ncbi:hypothetical protein MC378_15260 [Polaribacter sp. MSW13]|uniref:Uncharacterized protein n=1 Tax=Polaribacter marinus TaxID=2916838 RepID=A0A9X2ALE5_9FLAO|nr:hypothetical protein [Polaribacter marinus]MCI2230533.1 hypothetical protein [Polaribacter marinus]